MENKKILSVIVAVYNAEKYLKTCVNSILSQNYEHIQIILVDDGSQDSSLSICKEFESYHQNINVIEKENGGCFSARNAGFDKVIGDYIGFVDSDDYIVPEMYSTLIDLIEKYDADIATCDRYRNVDYKNDFNNMKRIKDIYHIYSGDEATKHLLCDTRYIKPAVWDKVYKKELFDGIRFPNTFFEDAAITYQLLYNANKIIMTEEQLYAYNVREGSNVKLPWSTIKTDSIFYVTESAISFFKKNKNETLLNAAIYWHVQIAIEAWERALKSETILSADLIRINKSVKKKYKLLNYNFLNFSLKKKLKKKVEFLIFAYFPNFLCKIKNLR